MDIGYKNSMLGELLYLYEEWGDLLTEEESDLIRESLEVARANGLEFIGDDVWKELDKIYKKYEGKNLNEYYTDEEEM
jgi:hypothetical protein